MKVAYIGNHSVDFSTESHIARALEHNGHSVIRLQEQDVWRGWAITDPAHVNRLGADFVLWTHTHDLGPPETHEDQYDVLTACEIPVVAYHLDRWWGLSREHQLDEPFFQCDLVVTADGGDHDWGSRGIEHVWLPPAVSLAECAPGTYRRELASDVAFVGSWQGGYHHEWTHRPALIDWLRGTYGERVRFWPQHGQPAVRGQMLRDVYASTKVLVGDSCLVGGATHYWSDRIPETIGRGGFLLHPYVEGLEEQFTILGDGKHLVTYTPFDWTALKTNIDYFCWDNPQRIRIAQRGRAHVLAEHTYEHRMEQLVAIMIERGML